MNAGDEVRVEGALYRVDGEWQRRGRSSTVLRLVPADPKRLGASGRALALKVMDTHLAPASVASLALRLDDFVRLPGMTACRRTVLCVQGKGNLLAPPSFPRLAIAMPWLKGPTWSEVLGGRRVLTRRESLVAATALAEALEGLEKAGVAHTDLSGHNLLLPLLEAEGEASPRSAISLVDLERFHTPDWSRPLDATPSPGRVAPRHAGTMAWSPLGDRFAGSLLIGEILGWCDAEVRAAGAGETWFEPQELQQTCARLALLLSALEKAWGPEAARLFRQAWESASPDRCPTFQEWTAVLRSLTPGSEAWAAQNPAAEGLSTPAFAPPWAPESAADPEVPPEPPPAGSTAQAPSPVPGGMSNGEAPSPCAPPEGGGARSEPERPLPPDPRPTEGAPAAAWMDRRAVAVLAVILGLAALWGSGRFVTSFGPAPAPSPVSVVHSRPSPSSRGTVEVVVTPVPFDVWVDGRLRRLGIASAERLDLPVGPHRIQIRRKGYRTVVRDFDVTPSTLQSWRETLKEARGTLAIRSTPPGARVVLAGRKRGLTPASLSLAPGTYRLRLEKDGYKAFEKRVVLRDGAKSSISAVLDFVPAPVQRPRVEPYHPGRSSSGGGGGMRQGVPVPRQY